MKNFGAEIHPSQPHSSSISQGSIVNCRRLFTRSQRDNNRKTERINGRITKFPTDSVVLKGNTNVFTCCSDIQKTIFWKHKPVGSPSTNDINDLLGLVNGYRFSRFNVTPGNSAGCQSLVTKDVTKGDEGMYICSDDAGLGQMKGWELIMLESFDCQESNRKDEYMGVNDFDLPQDVISAVCIAKYFGNVPPRPICEWSSGKRLLDNYHRHTETLLTTTLTIQMPARGELNGHQLFCYVKIDGDSSDKQSETLWKSSQLIINYASIHQKVVPQCSDDKLSLDCHPLCDYKMVRFSNGSSYCEITYPGKTSQKVFLLLQDNNMPGAANMHSSTHSPSEGHNPLSAIIALTAVAAGIVGFGIGIGVIFFICCCWIRRRSLQQNSNSIAMRGCTASGNRTAIRSLPSVSEFMSAWAAAYASMMNPQSNPGTPHSPIIHLSTTASENNNNNQEAVPLVSVTVGDTTARPECVIEDVEDGSTMTLNNEQAIQEPTVSMTKDNKPPLEDVDKKLMNLM